ncbi:hypothetical protein EG328_004490 [Venturia inaequalis]|uniref:Uncharacterized protein n=1 Tax=Venturia inaequalis TaxID=5025 RepID=A0A8H3ULX7_VENIN|nr:hypothetical protein EG328_004490 [Venturia inaequalis]
MPQKRKLSEMSAPEFSEEPPAMSTRSKRAKTTVPPSLQQQSIAKSIEFEESNDTKTRPGTKNRAMRPKEKVIIAAAQSIPTPSLTPSPTTPHDVEQPLPTKKKMTQKRKTTKAVSSKTATPASAIPFAPSSASSPDSTPQSQQQQHDSKQGTRKRTAFKAFSPLSTNLDSDSILAPSLALSQAEQQQQQQPFTKKQKTTRGRAIAKSVSPQSASHSDNISAAAAPPVVIEQQEMRTAKQKMSRKRATAKSVPPNAPIPNSDRILAPALAKVLSEQQEPRNSKQTKTKKRATKAVPASSPIASVETETTPLLSPAERVAKFWMDKCRKIFSEEDGFEVTIHALGDTGNQSKQQVFVWEKEYYDEAMLTRPNSMIPASRYDLSDDFILPEPSKANGDGSRSWTEKDCDFSKIGVAQPPATMEQYELAAEKLRTKFEERDVPILVIECRGADADSYWEWQNPSPTGLSRSYAQSPESKIQKALIAQVYTFDDIMVKYESESGWLTQEQCFCATAIGDKIKFWKHVSPYPHLKAWSGVLNKAAGEEIFDQLVGRKFAEVKEDGFEFAMEWEGRTNFTDA